MDETRKLLMQEALKEMEGLNNEGLEMLVKVIARFAEVGSSFAKDTTPESPEEISREQAQREAKEEARRASLPRYERNATMKTLGKQSVRAYAAKDEKIRAMYGELLEAQGQAREHEAGAFSMDCFTLGVIAGVRSERQKRKKGVAPVQQ